MSTEKLIEITAVLKMVEELAYEFEAVVKVPVSVADDPEALTEYLVGHEELWSGQVQEADRGVKDVSESPLSKGKWLKVLQSDTP
ncbi:hypothetical protein DF268_11725 [Streptomyces sp. V2]|uniref:hypothetical protein n=1 Tax=Streptomyces TaxID=1883 RepID=UPI0006EB2C0A|nr:MULTISPECIES: hypothetical protein [Streptomyces]PWG13333.1 hypothetical protein DF268_11725 [Streptomyces sp. V2]